MKTIAVDLGTTVYIDVEDDNYDESEIIAQARQKLIDEIHNYSKHDFWADILEEL